jgi:hypothetical protein
MPHDRLVGLAHRLVNHDTFSLIVAPAVADFEFESRAGGPRTTVRGYAGLCRAVAGAVAFDVTREFRLSIGDAAWRASRRDDVSDFAQMVLMQAVYYVFMLWIIGGINLNALAVRPLVENLTMVTLVIMATIVLPVITTAACYWGGRTARR